MSNIFEHKAVEDNSEVLKMMKAMGEGSAYIVGSYDEKGREKEAGTTLISNDDAIKKHMESAGAVPSPVTVIKPRAGRKAVIKKNNKKTITAEPIEQQPTRELEVVFLTQLGRIKAKILGYMEEENAVWLVFKDVSSIVYDPEVSANVKFSIDGDVFDTIYYGLKTKWFSNNNIIMVFLKGK